MLGNLGFIHKEDKMKKTLGYILGGLGIIAFALSYTSVRDFLKVPSLGLSDTIWMIAGIVLIVVGGYVLLRKKQEGAPREVPIYQGQRIIGYRRAG